MKIISRLLVSLALLGTCSFALADQGHRDHDRRDQDHGDRNDRHGDHRRHDDRHHDYRRHDDRRYGYRHGGRGHWERGHRYNGRSYVVRDYRHYRLRPPPRGYHWVRADNDYLLVAIATGVILDIALH